jgi:signal transduction histidine kinase
MLALVEQAGVLSELDVLRERVAHAEASERRRIGRELHDSTSQLLVAAQLSMAAVARRTFLTPEAQAALAEARQSIAGVQAEIRAVSYLLHPPPLPSDGLAQGLCAFCDGFARRTDLEITVKVARSLPRLSDRLELALYRIAQEALMNVYRHAQATKAVVRLRQAHGRIVLEIADDGVGLASPWEHVSGVGISGMQARMTELGGALTLEAGRGGLRVRAAAPIELTPEP